MENDESTSKDTEMEPDNSSELAGLSRGAARTAQSFSKRAMIGRIPKPRANAITDSTRLITKQVRIQRQVGKVTDRLSTIFDSYNAYRSSDLDLNRRAKKSKKVSDIAERLKNVALKASPVMSGMSFTIFLKYCLNIVEETLKVHCLDSLLLNLANHLQQL